MKVILVPTDYSPTAKNALAYSAELAKVSKARIVLMHAFHTPVPVTDVPYVMVTPDQLKKENVSRLKRQKNALGKKYPGLEIETIATEGFAMDEILNSAKTVSADLIVMGITGAGALGEAILGSVTTDVIREAKVPVLIVPEDGKFKKPSRIVFASDYSDINDPSALDMMKEFASKFSAKIFVVNVIRENDTASFSKAIAGLKLEKLLENTKHTLHFPVNTSVTEGINDFVETSGAQMVAMIAHKHNVFYRILNLSNTKKMAFRTHVPLLALPETTEKKTKKTVGKKQPE